MYTTNGIQQLLSLHALEARTRVSTLLKETRQHLLQVYYLFTLGAAVLVISYYHFIFHETAHFCFYLAAVSIFGLGCLRNGLYYTSRFIFTFLMPLVWVWACRAYSPELNLPIGMTMWLALTVPMFRNFKVLAFVIIYYLIGFLLAYHWSFEPDLIQFEYMGVVDSLVMFIPYTILVFYSYGKFLDTNKKVHQEIIEKTGQLQELNATLRSSLTKTADEFDILTHSIGEELRNDVGQEFVLLKNDLVLDKAKSEDLRTVDNCIDQVRMLSDLLYPRRIELFGLAKSIESLVKALNNKKDQSMIFVFNEVESIENCFTIDQKFHTYRILFLLLDLSREAEGVNFCRAQTFCKPDYSGIELLFDGSSVILEDLNTNSNVSRLFMIKQYADLYNIEIEGYWVPDESLNKIVLKKNNLL